MKLIANIYCRFYEISVTHKIKIEIIELCTIHVQIAMGYLRNTQFANLTVNIRILDQIMIQMTIILLMK